MVFMNRKIFENKQRVLTYILLIGGAILLTAEYFVVRWYPGHEQRVTEAILNQLPYQNDGLGVQMQVAAGIYGKIETYPGGVKIYRPRLFGGGPSLIVTSEPNPTSASKFSPQYVADVETAGVRNQLAEYQVQNHTIHNRDALLIWQFNPRAQSMNVTARVIAPDRIVQAVCDTGSTKRNVYTQACDQSLLSIKVAGPPSDLEGPVNQTDSDPDAPSVSHAHAHVEKN